MSQSEYIIIITIRNEEKYIGRVLRCVFSQTVPATEIIVVDDGSTDKTCEICNKYDITLIHVHNERIPYRGHNQVMALNEGIRYAERHYMYDYILKIDGDSEIESTYAEYLLTKMNQNPILGMASGMSKYQTLRGTRPSDAAKMIRAKCWDDINGYTVTSGFDSHALLKARQCGYETKAFKEATFNELRPSNKIDLKHWWDDGVNRKRWGYGLFHVIAAAAKNMVTGSPWILGGLTIIAGYLFSNPEPDPELDREWVKKDGTKEILEFFRR